MARHKATDIITTTRGDMTYKAALIIQRELKDKAISNQQIRVDGIVICPVCETTEQTISSGQCVKCKRDKGRKTPTKEHKNHDLNHKLAEVQSALDEERHAHDVTRETATSRYAYIGQIEATIKEQDKAINEVWSENAEQKARIEELEADEKVQDQVIKNLQQAQADYKAKNAALNAHVLELDQENTDLGGELLTLSKRLRSTS